MYPYVNYYDPTFQFQSDPYVQYDQFDSSRQQILQLPQWQQLQRRVNQLERENDQQRREIDQLQRRLQRINQRLRNVERRLNIPFTAQDGEF